jgi:hypothetical protein
MLCIRCNCLLLCFCNVDIWCWVVVGYIACVIGCTVFIQAYAVTSVSSLGIRQVIVTAREVRVGELEEFVKKFNGS